MSARRHIAMTVQGRGPRLVVLHGWTMTSAVMAPLAALLAPDFTVVVPDLPGHGATRGFAPDMAGGAALLAELLADGEPTVVIGWSLGALLAWQAQDLPAVAGVVSLDMSPFAVSGGDWPLGMRGQSAEALAARAAKLEAAWPQAAAAIATSLFSSGLGHPMHGQIAQIVAAQDKRAMISYWRALLEADCRETLRGFHLPLLAIHGAESSVYPAALAGWIARNVPMAETHLLDGVGHAPHLEAPETTAALIGAFARKVLAR